MKTLKKLDSRRRYRYRIEIDNHFPFLPDIGIFYTAEHLR